MKKIITLIFLLTLSEYTPAQKINFCKSYTDKGIPVDLVDPNNLKIGEDICILVQIPELSKEQEILFFYIDLVSGKTKVNQLNRAFKISESKKWFVLFYKFIKGGNFEVSLFNSNKKRLIGSSFEIKTNEIITEDPVQDEYYKNIETGFYAKVVDNVPYEKLERISLISNIEPLLFLKNDKPIATDIINLRIWRKKADGKFSELVSSRKFQASGDWMDTFLKIKFLKPGDHKIMLFNHNELLMKTIYISIIE